MVEQKVTINYPQLADMEEPNELKPHYQSNFQPAYGTRHTTAHS
jgi:hypothetical protein